MEFQKDKPEKKEFEKRSISEGKKIFVPVGAAYKMRNGKKILEIASVIINDLEKNGEEGLIYVDQLYLTPNALFRLSNFVIAIGWDQPFDYDSIDDITKVMLTGPFEGVMKSREYNGNSYINLTFYNSANCKRDKDGEPIFTQQEDKYITAGEQGWEKILKFRQENSDKYGDYLNSSSSGDNNSGDDYDEIPF